MIIVVGLSHKNAPIEVRERLRRLDEQRVRGARAPPRAPRHRGGAGALDLQPRRGLCRRSRSRCLRHGALHARRRTRPPRCSPRLGGDVVRGHLLQQVGKAAVRSSCSASPPRSTRSSSVSRRSWDSSRRPSRWPAGRRSLGHARQCAATGLCGSASACARRRRSAPGRSRCPASRWSWRARDLRRSRWAHERAHRRRRDGRGRGQAPGASRWPPRDRVTAAWIAPRRWPRRSGASRGRGAISSGRSSRRTS